MTDIATLGVKVDATSADQAAVALDKLSAAGGRAESATERLAAETRAAMAGMSGISSAIGEFAGRADRLKASVDPLGATIDRINAEMREADALYKLAAIGAEEYGRYINVLEDRLELAVVAQNRLAEAQARGQKQAGLLAYESLNLSRQMTDVGVSLAMGMNPLMVLIAQGPQIADIFQGAAQRGVGFRDALVGLGRQLGLLTTVQSGAATEAAALGTAHAAQAAGATAAAGAEARLGAAMAGTAAGAAVAVAGAEAVTVANAEIAASASAAAAAETVALAPLAVILGGVAAALAVVGVGFAVAADEINGAGESADQLQKRLGLTDAQMKRVTESGENLRVTMGDTFVATVQIAGRAIADALNLDEVWKAIKAGYGAAVDWTIEFARQSVGVIGGAVGGIKAAWSLLPAAMGEAMVIASNGVIDVVEAMVNLVIDKINLISGAVNQAASVVGLPEVIQHLENVTMPRINKTFAGAGASAVLAFAKGAAEGRADAIAGLDQVMADIAEQARKNRDKRLMGEAGEAGKTRRAGKTDAERDYEALIRASQNYLDQLRDETEQMGMSEVQRRKLASANVIAALSVNGWTEEERRLAAAIAEATDQWVRRYEILQAIEQLQSKVSGLDREFAGGFAKPADDPMVKEAEAAADQAARFAEIMDQVADQVRDSARGMADAFGPVGDAIGDIANTVADYDANMAASAARRAGEFTRLQAILKDERKSRAEKNKATLDWSHSEVLAAKEEARARVEAYGDMLGAAKGFFEEGSDGYRLMQAAEAAYRAFQMASTIQAMIMGTTETAKTVADAGVKAAADTAAGGAKMFAQLGVYAFPAVAAMIGVMAALGSRSSGVAAGPSIPEDQTSEYRQRVQGAGSVLGDAAAKSASVANSLEIVASNSNRDLEYTNSMLQALRSIDDQIGVVASAIGRQLGIGGVFSTDGLGLGSVTKDSGGIMKFLSPLLGFGKTTYTTTLADQGLDFSSGSLAQIIANGISGVTYQVLQKSKTKSGFLGIGGGTTNWTETRTSGLPNDISQAVGNLLRSVRDGIVEAADVLGMTGAEAVLNSFKVNIGKISLEGMGAQEITDTLNAVFGKVADDMVAYAIPGLKEVQKIGEGLFETLSRVAREYQVVDVSLKSIGKTFGLVGATSIQARDRLVQLFGGMDEFTDAISSYADDFLTEAERLAPIQQAVTAELARLGLSNVTTRDQFKAVVQGLDLTTQAGAELFASLMNLAPAFAKVTEENTAQAQAIADARNTLSDAYDRESGALQDTLDRFRGLASGLSQYRQSLYAGPAAALSPEAQYQANRAEFERVAGLAAQGNERALGDLQSVSEAYLNASRDYYASSRGYFDDLAAVRDAVTVAEAAAADQVDVATQQLDALEASVAELIDLNTNVVSVAEAINSLNALLGGTSQAALPQAVAAQQQSQAQSDNSALIAQLQANQERLEQQMQALIAEVRAGNSQRGAIAVQQIAVLQEQLDAANRQIRELQAA